MSDYIYRLIQSDLKKGVIKAEKGFGVKEMYEAKSMEDMNGEELKIILKMILQIVKDSKDKEGAIKKIEELRNN